VIKPRDRLSLKKKSSATPELETVEELKHQINLLSARLSHTDVELVQARASRDHWKAKYIEVMTGPKSEKAPTEAEA
jgi:hypothetical protein